jgi:deoxyribodipyrimidine photo-lyase
LSKKFEPVEGPLTSYHFVPTLTRVTLQEELGKLSIPLYTASHTPRKTLPDEVIKLARKWGAARLYANIEYEIDELRRDLRIVHLATMGNIRAEFFSDRCVVEPGALATKTGNQYAVGTFYSGDFPCSITEC